MVAVPHPVSQDSVNQQVHAKAHQQQDYVQAHPIFNVATVLEDRPVAHQPSMPQL